MIHRAPFLLNSLLFFSLASTFLSACREAQAPNLTPKARTLELEQSLAATEAERDEALDELRQEQEEAAEKVRKLNDQKSNILREKDEAQRTIVEVKGELERNASLTADQKKTYEQRLAAAEKDKADLDARLNATDTQLADAMNRINQLNQQIATLRATINSLNAQIATLQQELAAAKAAAPGPVASVASSGAVFSTLNLEFNSTQCLNLSGRGAIGSCSLETARILVAGGAGGELRIRGTNTCLGLALGEDAPRMEVCNGSTAQQWNFRYRSDQTSFRIENAAFVGPNNAPVCLRNSGNQFVMDICSNPVTYFFKNNYSL